MFPIAPASILPSIEVCDPSGVILRRTQTYGVDVLSLDAWLVEFDRDLVRRMLWFADSAMRTTRGRSGR